MPVSSDAYTDAAIWSWSQKTSVLCHWHTRWSRREHCHIYIVEGRWGLRLIEIDNGTRWTAYSIPPHEMQWLKQDVEKLHKTHRLFNATALMHREWIVGRSKDEAGRVSGAIGSNCAVSRQG